MPPAICHSVGPITSLIVGRHVSTMSPSNVAQSTERFFSQPLTPSSLILAQGVQGLVTPELCLPDMLRAPEVPIQGHQNHWLEKGPIYNTSNTSFI